MKVCFVCPNALLLFGIAAERNFGGAEVQIRQIAKYLAEQGSDVDILVGTELGPEPKEIDGIRLIPGVEDTSRTGFLNTLRAKLTLLKALGESRADVYVTTCAAADAGFIAIYARFLRRAFVYRISCDMDADGRFERQNGWRGRLFGLGLRSADVVIAQHRDQAAQLARRGIASSIVRNSFEIHPGNVRKLRDIDALWVGRWEPLKRPWLFVEMAGRLPGRRFTMICAVKRGEEQLLHDLRRSASNLPNLTFLDGVPFADVQSYFERSKILVGTSETEGFPNTYIQACPAGTPIASLDVDPENFVKLNKCGVVEHGNFEALVEGIERLLSDRAEWESCSRNARAYATRMHNLESEGVKWAKLLRSVMRSSGPSRAEDSQTAKTSELV